MPAKVDVSSPTYAGFTTDRKRNTTIGSASSTTADSRPSAVSVSI